MKVYRQNAYNATTYRAAYTAWYNALSVPQQAAIYDYTDSGYRSLNHCLRYNKPLNPRDSDLLKHIDTALAANGAAQIPRRLMRSVKQLTTLPKCGDTMQVSHYVSTTSDPHQLFKFADATAPIIFEIHTTVGTPVSDIHDEYEFLLPRDTAFIVNEVSHGIDWHAEYEGTDYSRAFNKATVIKLTQENDDPRSTLPPPDA